MISKFITLTTGLSEPFTINVDEVFAIRGCSDGTTQLSIKGNDSNPETFFEPHDEVIRLINGGKPVTDKFILNELPEITLGMPTTLEVPLS